MAGIPGFLKWIVRNADGSIAVDPLTTIHQSTFSVWGPQAGQPARSSLGTFRIPLPPPTSDKYKWAQADLAKMQVGQRLEAYLTASPNDSPGVWGDPKFSGILTSFPKDLGSASLGGFDSMWLAQMARTGRTDLFAGTSDTLVTYGLKGYSKLWGDGGRSKVWTLANYTNNGGWSQAGADGTNDGFKTVRTPSSTGDGLLWTNTSFTNAQYADCYVTAAYHIGSDTAAGAYAEAGCIAAVADANNLILGRATQTRLTATTWSIRAEIFQKSGGVYTQRDGKEVFIDNKQHQRLQPVLIGLQLSSTLYQWRLNINGREGAFWIQTVTAGNPVGSIGLRSLKAGTSLAEDAWCMQLGFFSKAALFQPGTITAGPTSITEVLTSMPVQELWNLAMTVENTYSWRKNPKAASTTTPYPDTIDFGVLGTDLSSSIAFREKVNIVSSAVDPNAEPFATSLTVTGGPGVDGSGFFTIYDFDAIDKYGMFIDTVPAPWVADQVALRNYADRILQRRVAPMASITVEVLREADTVEKWREGDTIMLDVPTEYINNVPTVIAGYDFTEGSPTQRVTLAQLPLTTVNYLRNLNNLTNALTNGTYFIRRMPSG